MSPRFFIEGVHECGERVRIDDADAHHMRDVLRLHEGDRVEVVDSASQAFVARLAPRGEQLFATLVERRDPLPLPRLRVDVAQAMPKGTKMDFIVEKATELGAGAVIPFSSERTIARAAGAERVTRWRRIAKGAAEQCGRRDVPAIAEPTDFGAVLDRFCAYDVVLLAWESAQEPLREQLPALVAGARSALVVIGPEGGFSRAEVEAAEARGAAIISLGDRILRTETAALVLLAILHYIIGNERSAQHARRINTA